MAAWLWRRGTIRHLFCLLSVAIFLHSVLTVGLWRRFDKDRTQRGGYSSQQSRDIHVVEPTELQRLVLMKHVMESPVPAEMFPAEASPERPCREPCAPAGRSRRALSSPGRSHRVPFAPNLPLQAPVVLEDLVSPEEPPVSNIAAVILSFSSSESSLLGEMFNQHPDFFYMFEPLYSLGVSARSKTNATGAEPTERLKARILHDVISCDFSAWENHFKTYFKDENFGGWQRSRDIQQACSISEKYFKLKKTCPIQDQDIPAVLHAVCLRRKHSAVTFAQARNLASLATLFREPNQGTPSPVSGGLTVEDKQLLWEEGLYPVIAGGDPAPSTSRSPDVRLLLVVRDPRAWLTSRLRQLYQNVTRFQPGHVTAARPQDYCDWVLAISRSDPTSPHGSYMNNTWAKTRGLEGRFAVVRHEDVIGRPQQIARKVYRFVNVPMHPSVLKWLQENTQNESTPREMFSSRRNFQEPVNSWQTALRFAAIKKIQAIASCRTVMVMFSYKIVRDVADLNSTAKSRKGEKREDLPTF